MDAPGVLVDAMHNGVPDPWEVEAIARHKEAVNRIEGDGRRGRISRPRDDDNEQNPCVSRVRIEAEVAGNTTRLNLSSNNADLRRRGQANHLILAHKRKG